MFLARVSSQLGLYIIQLQWLSLWFCWQWLSSFGLRISCISYSFGLQERDRGSRCG